MKYFLHDTNAFQDEKITQLFVRFGYEGIGLFYTILEKIGAQEKPIKTEVLKKQLHVKKKLEKSWCFMEEIGIISSNNGETFNKRILSYSKKYKIKNKKTAKRVSEWRKNQTIEKNVTHDETITEQDGNSLKVKVSKVKESKERIYAHPRLEEVKKYFTENGYSEQSANKAFMFYNENNWHDSNGKEVKNWKQKMISVWFKNEDKVPVSANGKHKTFIDPAENTW